MSRKSRETIGPNVDIPSTTESNAFQDVHEITAQISQRCAQSDRGVKRRRKESSPS